MDAPYWGRSFGETTPPGGGGGRGSLKYLAGWAGNIVVQPTSVGNYYVTEPNVKLVQTKQLNPYAKEWSPNIHGAPVEDRCLFVTFSNGHPITEHQIAIFFVHKYGDCLERVYVHWPQRKNYRDIVTPQFGKVIFKESLIPLTITDCGKKQCKFMIDGKPLWCKKFDSNKTHAFRRN
ncbi:hypothetical protein CRYUN_Cryun14cG0014600 [Craigia yunnanensis]